MADSLQFELVSPERKLASVEANSVTIPGMEGDLTAMPNHAPFMTTLRPGHVVVRGSDEERFFVSGGFAEIYDNTVTVLAEIGMQASELTRDWLEERIERQREVVEQAEGENVRPATQKLNDYLGVLAQTDLPAGS